MEARQKNNFFTVCQKVFRVVQIQIYLTQCIDKCSRQNTYSKNTEKVLNKTIYRINRNRYFYNVIKSMKKKIHYTFY